MTIDTEIRHVTKPGANLFLELGFSPAEAKRLQAASRKQINDTRLLLGIGRRTSRRRCWRSTRRGETLPLTGFGVRLRPGPAPSSYPTLPATRRCAASTERQRRRSVTQRINCCGSRAR